MNRATIVPKFGQNLTEFSVSCCTSINHHNGANVGNEAFNRGPSSDSILVIFWPTLSSELAVQLLASGDSQCNHLTKDVQKRS